MNQTHEFIRDVSDFETLTEICKLQDLIRSVDKDNVQSVAAEISQIKDKLIFSWAIHLISYYESSYIRQQSLYDELLININIPEYSNRDLLQASPRLYHLLYTKGLISMKTIKSKINNADIEFAFCKELHKKPTHWYYETEFEINNDKVYSDILEYGYPSDSIEFAIKYDDIDRLQDIASSPGFNFSMKLRNNMNDTIFIAGRLTPIMLAAACGSLECFKFLALSGAETDTNLAKCSVIGGNTEIVRLCEQLKCDFSSCKSIAIQFHRNDIYDWLQYHYPDEADSNLINAVSFQNAKAIVYYVQNHQNLNQTDESGCTPLHIAAFHNDVQVMKYLIEKGAKTDMKTINNDSLLNIALMRNNTEAADYIRSLH